MKKITCNVLTLLLLAILQQGHTYAQGPFCNVGGCSGPVSQNPGGILSASTSWTSTGPVMSAGQYAAFNVIQGNTYEWSTCGDFGGTQQSSMDAELTLCNSSWQILCFNDNSGRPNCPNAPYVGWQATYTGVAYVLLKNAWSGQCLNSPAGQTILVWRQSATGTVCTNWSVSPSTQSNVPSSGGSYNATVFASGLCNYNLTFNNTWLHFVNTGPNGVFYYNVDANPGGQRTGTISINNATNGVNNVATLTVAQNAATSALPVINLSGDLNFGTIQTGTTAQRTLTIANTGNAPLNINSINFPTGFNGNWSSGTISAGGFQNVIVTFLPTSAISYGGNITVFSNASNGAQSIACSGTGSNSPVTSINVTGNLAFGNVQVATSVQRTMTITNTGNTNLNVSSIIYPSGFSGNWNSGIILPGNSRDVTVTFTPVSAIFYGGNITIISNATTGTSTISCSGTGIAVVVPAVSSLICINRIQNHTNLPEDFIFYNDFTPNSNNDPIKVCADGTGATWLKIRVASDPDKFGFRILRRNLQPANASDADTIGFLGSPTVISSDEVKVQYTAPGYMNVNDISRKLTLQITYNGTPVSNINFPLHIYRAPVVFVHGLYGIKETFQDMADYLVSGGLYPAFQQNSNSLLHLADYRTTNGNSFKANRKVVGSNIDLALIKARNAGISCSKVDVVAHSMGGILSRLYLQSTWENVPYRFDIHKLITLNTPHFGTQFANLMHELDNTISSSNTLFLIKEIIFASLPDYNGTGAIEDLQVDSKEITDYLNVPVNYQNIVPSHVISTTKELSNVTADASKFERGAKFLVSNQPTLYNGEASDIIVPLSSQKANFAWPITSNNQFHVGSARNSDIKQKVKDLLNAPPTNSANFNSSGFIPGKLEYHSQQTSLVSNKTNNSDSVYFILPQQNTQIAYGDSVSISIGGTSGISHLLYVENIYDSVCNIIDSTTNLLVTKIKPLSKKIGNVTMGVLGSNDGGIIVGDTVGVYINPPFGLIELDVEPEIVNINLGQTAFVDIQGKYPNGLSLDLSAVNNLQINADTNKIQYIGGGMLYGKSATDSTIIFSYNGISDTITVRVLDASDANVSSFTFSKYRICIGDAVNFHDESRGLITARNWYFPGGIPSVSNSEHPNVVYTSSGDFKVKLVTTFANGIDSLSIDSLIEVRLPTSTVTSGNWSNPQIWRCGSVPGAGDSVVIRVGHQVDMNISAQIRKLAIEENASLNISKPDASLVVGFDSLKNAPVFCDGTLNISNGIFRLNGSIQMTNRSHFNMTAGKIVIDGNTGELASSVPDGQYLFSVSTDSANFHFSGGILQIVNPPFGANSQAIQCNHNFGAGSMLILGDGISVIGSNNPSGFGGNALPKEIGKLIYDPVNTVNNRWFKNLNPLLIREKCEVRSGNLTPVAQLKIIDSMALLDFDGNVYPVISICSNQWTAQNLSVSHYRNGDAIPQVQDSVAWANLTTGAWCYYQNSTASGVVYGKLYNWYAVNDPRGLAPAGWHIATDAEWTAMADSCLGGANIAAGALKSTGLLSNNTGLWLGDSNTSTNSSGFTGLPAGCRLHTGSFVNINAAGMWWTGTPATASTAWYREADMGTDELSSASFNRKLGLSVRCVKD